MKNHHARRLPRSVPLARRPRPADDIRTVLRTHSGGLPSPAHLGRLCLLLAASSTDPGDSSMGSGQSCKIPVSSGSISQQKPTHELATEEFLRIPGPGELPFNPYGKSSIAREPPSAAAYQQPNLPPAPHFLAVGHKGHQPASRLYCMGPTPFSTPLMPKKTPFADSPHSDV